MSRVFISYSHDDKALTAELAELLEGLGHDVWFDRKLKGGEEWWNRIEQEIRSRDAFIFLMSQASLTSEICNRELETARTSNKPIVPIKVRRTLDIPTAVEYLNDLHRIDLLDGISASKLIEINRALGSQLLYANTYTDAHREADLRLLATLWKHIGSTCISNLDFQVDTHVVEYDFYKETIVRYGWLRNAKENHFINQVLEDSFLHFDEALSAFEIHFGMHWSTESPEGVGGRKILMSHLKFADRNPDSSASLDYHLQVHDATLQLLDDVLSTHEQLVGVIKQIMPQFDFPHDCGALE